MGSVYVRKGETRLIVGYRDVDGKWKARYTRHVVGEEDKARRELEAVEANIAARRRLGDVELGPPTVERYAKRWVADRQKRGVGSVDDDAGRLARHVLPMLGAFPLAEIRPRHIRDLVRALRTKCGSEKNELAPRTVRHCYAVTRRLFEDAVAEELIQVNPCALKRGELPAKVDKNPTWRAGAVFTRQEVEQLLSDELVPEERRLLYALLFLGGMRVGEAAALRWRAYEPKSEPLGRLLIATSFNRKRGEEKGVKTDRPRELPVHPVLAKVLANWRVGGWQRYMGRSTSEDDLVLPAATGNNLRDPVVHANLQRDLAALGLRARRVHDARRTFISLALADGARKDILRWVTHGPEGDIISAYTTLPWSALCEEVAKLRVGLREGRLLELPKAANSLNQGGNPTAGVTAGANASRKTLLLHNLTTPQPNAQGGIRSPQDSSTQLQPGAVSREITNTCAATDAPPRISARADRSNAVSDSGPATASAEQVGSLLQAASASWEEAHDVRALRKALLGVLARLEDSEPQGGPLNG
jgi:integrase